MKGNTGPLPALPLAQNALSSLTVPADDACHVRFFQNQAEADGGVCGFPCRASLPLTIVGRWFCWFPYFGRWPDGKAVGAALAGSPGE